MIGVEYFAEMAALVTAAVLCLALGPLIIPVLKRLKLGQYVRDDGPARHLSKSGTPTMGGLIFLPAAVLATLVWAPRGVELNLLLVTMVGYALIGFGDDYLKIGKKQSLGLRARQKLAAQIILALVLASVAVFYLDRGTEISFPGWSGGLDLGWWYFPFAVVVIVGFSNAVNLTDGLDGLASGIAVTAGLAFAFICHAQGAEVPAVAAAALAGACGGFLAYNRHPARVFMGDTGSLAIGALLGGLAVLTRSELLLVIIGGVYVWETFTVSMQVLSFKLTGKRIWRMTPYHHHLELGGWPEVRVVQALWAVSAVLAVAGVLLTAYLG